MLPDGEKFKYLIKTKRYNIKGYELCAVIVNIIKSNSYVVSAFVK